MRRRRLLAVSGALLAGAVAGCTESSDEPDPNGPGAPGDGAPAGRPEQAPATALTSLDDEALEALVARTNGFTIDLHRQLLADRGDENVFCSPISASIAFAMVDAGARGETRRQLREAFRYPDQELHATMGKLQSHLDQRGRGDKGDGDDDSGTSGDADEETAFQLSIANAVWGQEDYAFKQGYLDTLAEEYDAGLNEAAFVSSYEDERERINDWVADQTDGTIEELLPRGALNSLTRLVLVNAIYFLANWAHTFPEEATTDEGFTALDGTNHDVSMMSLEREWTYAEREGVQAVELPYVGDDAAMIAVLPPAGEFKSYEQELNAQQLAGLIDELGSRSGTVQLPRFEFTTSVRLSDPLKALGVTDAFDPDRADLTGIASPETSKDLYLKEAYHDAAVAVDEEGTEAAAATGAVLGSTMAPADPFEFVADRPFLFVIRDKPTGTILFIGRAVDPTGWA